MYNVCTCIQLHVQVSACTQTCMPIPALPRCSSEICGCLQAGLLSLSLAAQSWEWLSEHPLPVHDSAHPFGYHIPVHIYMYMNMNTALIGHAMVYMWCNLYIVHVNDHVHVHIHRVAHPSICTCMVHSSVHTHV